MGTVVISIDAELGWGFHDRDVLPTSRIQAARSGWLRLVEFFDEMQIPATWGIVGHLLLDDCDGVHDRHPSSPDWFATEREQWRDRPEYRFGGELFDAVSEADADHEIASHSFSHVEFGDESTTESIARAELTQSVSVAEDHGLSFDSFIFPRNEIGYRHLLAECGFTCYRSESPDKSARYKFQNQFRKLARATVPGHAPPVVEPFIDEHGLVAIPASLYLYGFEGIARDVATSIMGDPVVRQARRGIDAVADDDGIFHIWFHPNNLVGEREINRLRAILEYLHERREATDLEVATMAEVAARNLPERKEKVTPSPTV